MPRASNLVQWLQLREMGMIDRLPLDLMKGIANSRESDVSYIMIWTKLADICQLIQLEKNCNSTWCETAVSKIEMNLQLVSQTEDQQRQYLMDALDNGLLAVLQVMINEIPRFSATQTPSMRAKAVVLLITIAEKIDEFALLEYVPTFVKTLQSIFWNRNSLLQSLDILCLLEKLPRAIQDRFLVSFHLEIDSFRSHKAFYEAFHKLKEIVTFNLVGVVQNQCNEAYHRVIRMNGVIEKIVHESYCTAICLEWLFHQPSEACTTHKILLATLKLHELLWLISALLDVYRNSCLCRDCSHLMERIVKGGLSRVIHTLIKIITFVPARHMSFIQTFSDCLADLIGKICMQTHEAFIMWYILYTEEDLQRMLDICLLHWESDEMAPTFSSMLAVARRKVLDMCATEYVLDPVFHYIPCNFRRRIEPRETILMMRRLERGDKIQGHMALIAALRLVENKVDDYWPDRKYWSDVNVAMLYGLRNGF